MLRTICLLAVLLTQRFALAGVSVPWTQFQADAWHSGHVTGTISSTTPAPIWSVTAAGMHEASFVLGAVTDSNHVYLTADNRGQVLNSYFDVIALDRKTGSEAWLREVASYAGQTSAPSADNSLVYVHQWGHSGISGGNPSQYPYVTGMSAATGAISFATSHSGQWESGSRPTVQGTQVFAAGGYYGGLDSYDSTTGAHQWFSDVNQQYGWIPAADLQRVYVYMGPASASPGPEIGTLYAFNRVSGGLDFSIQNPGDTFTFYNGTVSLGSQQDALTLTTQGLVSFDLNARNVRWHVAGNFTGAMAIDQGNVFAANGIELDQLDEATGSKVHSWFAPAGASLTGNLLATDNAVIVGTTKGTYAIDRSTLTTLWSLPIQGDLALGNDVLLISTTDGLNAYSVPEPSTGTLLVCCALFSWPRTRIVRRLSQGIGRFDLTKWAPPIDGLLTRRLLFALLFAGIPLFALDAKADWLTHGGDASQRSYAPVAFDPNSLKSDWSVGAGVSLAIADGKVVTSDGGALHAYDFNTGKSLWDVTGATFHELTIFDGAVYVATGLHSDSCGVTCAEKTYLRSYQLSDGTFRFRTEFSSQWYSGWGPVPYGDSLYMNGGYYGGLYRFFTVGGSQFLSLAQYDSWQPAVDTNYVYAYLYGNLQVIDRQNLTIVKSISNPNYSWSGYSMYTNPVLGDAHDVFVAHEGRLMSFDIINGDIKWSDGPSFSGQPVYNGGVVYAYSAGALAAVDATTGNQLWGWESPNEDLSGDMLLTSADIFVQGPGGTYAIDLQTHKKVWSSPDLGNLAYSDGRLFIGGSTFVAVPEPSSAVLICLAAVAFAVSQRRADQVG
jgi:outer membrane protein assembly factor BamB